MGTSFENLGRKPPPKIDNHKAGFKAKAEIRRKVLEAIGAEGAHVFDAFAGRGKMHKAVWHAARHYVGCDLRWFPDGRMAFVADNKRVLRSIDVAPFNIFDLDAYGSPWDQVLIIAARRRVQPGERIGLVLTDGLGLSFKVNNMPRAVTRLTGVKNHIVGMSRKQDDILDRAVLGAAKAMRCTIECRWQAERKGGAAMRYVGLVMVGNG